MKAKIILLLLFVSSLNVWAQTIVSPTYSRRDVTSLTINEVERTAQYTIIKGVYENVLNYGWANIGNTTYLKDTRTGRKLGTIIRSSRQP